MLIDKEAAYIALKREAEAHLLPDSHEAYERAARIIDQMKPVEAEPMRHGWWIAIDNKTAKCSCCGWYQNAIRAASISEGSFGKVYRFCTACGARMDGGAEDG